MFAALDQREPWPSMWWTILGPYARNGRSTTLAEAKRYAETIYRAGSIRGAISWTEEDDEREREEEKLVALGGEHRVWITLAPPAIECARCRKRVPEGSRCIVIQHLYHHLSCASEALKGLVEGAPCPYCDDSSERCHKLSDNMVSTAKWVKDEYRPPSSLTSSRSADVSWARTWRLHGDCLETPGEEYKFLLTVGAFWLGMGVQGYPEEGKHAFGGYDD